jgi:glutathione S-transferase
MMRLYYSPGACSLAPHIVAREAGVPLELERVDLATKKTDSATDYLKINPKGSVPALVLDDGTVLTEAAVIIQFLADLAPSSDLLPSIVSNERYASLEWLNFIATELHKGFGPLWRSDTPAAMRTVVKDTLATKFSYLDRHLAGRPYLLGDRFTAPDAYAFTVLSWAQFMKIDLGRWPNVTDYLERISARPQVREALVAEGIISTDAQAA